MACGGEQDKTVSAVIHPHENWLGAIPPMRRERRYGHRVVNAFSARPGSVNAMLAGAMGTDPMGEAIVCGDVRLSYAALGGEVQRIAGGLGALGVRQGDRVAILLANGTEFLASLLAIMHLGAIAVLLNIREQRPELAYVLADSSAVVLIHGAELRPQVPDAADTPDLQYRICVGAAAAGEIAFDSLRDAEAVPSAEFGEEAVAAILYTSGTTGRPKGAMLTHASIVHAAMIYEVCMDLRAGERSVATVPLSHVTGLTAGIAAMLRVAGTLVIAPPFKAESFLELAARERMTHTVMVPAMYALCLMSPAFGETDLRSWRIGGYGGAPMPASAIADLAARLPGLRLMNAYGSTETTGPVVLMPPSASRQRATAVGRAVPGCDIRVMDEHGREVATGEAGEIWLAAANVVPGYWRNAEATGTSFIGGYWCSGDIGCLDGEGYLTLLDRKKDMINRGGFKIYSVEVENVLAAHPSVAEAAVIGRPCPVLGERVHAIVVPRPGVTSLAAQDIARHCAGRLADYKVPETVSVRSTPLPRNANGKVLKRALRDDPSG